MAARTKLLDPISPGEVLMEEFMRPLGLSMNALARALAVPANRVSGIVRGTRAISADTALRLGKYFGTSPEICSTCSPTTSFGSRDKRHGDTSNQRCRFEQREDRN